MGPGPGPADLNPALVVRLATEAAGFLEFDLVERAQERAERLLATRAGRLAGLALKAECLRRRERYREALPLLREALDQSPEDESLWINLGWCLKRSGRLPEAVAAMEGLLAELPDSALGHYNLSCYLALSGERERCLAALGRALGLDDSLRGQIPGEGDFDSLRQDPQFRRLTGP